MSRPNDPIGREHDRRQSGQHSGQRYHAAAVSSGILFSRLQFDRFSPTKSRRFVYAGVRRGVHRCQGAPQIVSERPHVKTGRTVQAERHPFCLDANDFEAMDSDAYRGRSGGGRVAARSGQSALPRVPGDELRSPSIFFAEYAGGCWLNVPRNAFSARSMASRDGIGPTCAGPVGVLPHPPCRSTHPAG